jgi:very-short-patch-repair endonuclease
MPGTAPSRSRRAAVKAVLPRWRSQLIDVSGGNRLLYYRDLKVATLDLADASPNALNELLEGRSVRAGRVFPDPLRLPLVVKATKAIEKPARVYAEEFGQAVTHLASGFASWDRGDQKAPNAPVLLRHVDFSALPGSSDAFELTASDEILINPVLLHVLEAEHGVLIDDTDLLERYGDDEDALFEQLSKLAADNVDGFTITRRSVIANFAYASQPMVEDLDEDELSFLAGNDMVAALGGDAEATQAVLGAGHEVSITEPDHNDPSDEHLILDADGSQSYVINAIVAGQHLVVQGPPGTGKTQTIANTVAELVARGKTVLFVAQKRAAITAVLSRLDDAGLGDLVLDLFDGANSRKRVVGDIGRRLDSLRSTPRPNAHALQNSYVSARDTLVRHREAMHEIRAPWGLALLGAKVDGHCEDGFYDWAVHSAHQATEVRLGINDLQRWDVDTHDLLRRALRELATRGALTADFHTRSGWKPAAISSSAVLQGAEAAADRLRSTSLPDLTDRVQRAASALTVTVPPALNLPWASSFAQHLVSINQGYAQGLGPVLSQAALSDDDLERWIYASGDKTFRHEHPQELGMFARRKLRKTLEQVLPERSLTEHHTGLIWVQQLRASWLSFSGTPIPAVPDATWDGLAAAVEGLQNDLAAIRQTTQGLHLDGLEDLPAALAKLLGDRSRNALPRLHELEQQLHSCGAGPVLDDIRQHAAGLEEWEAADRLSYAFSQTVIDHLDRTDPRLAGLEAADLNRATSDFQHADVDLRKANASRVRRAAAELLVEALDTHPEQAERIRGQVKRKRGFLPIRALVSDVAPDVVLAAKPVWAASPQAVSQLLPSRQLFDVVLFDEASQVLPAAAIPSIARARQLVVAGDELQLPPTTIFTRTSELGDAEVNLDEFEPEDDEDSAGPLPERGEAPDTESILDAVGVKLGTQRSRYLAWHYRSRDERLIATSNQFLYRPNGRMMTTFPASDSADALRHVQCPPSTGLGRTNLSPAGEVHQVVDLMLEHARIQAGMAKPQSLGVIAFGQKHSARIEREFEQRLTSESDAVKAYFADTGAEKYFIKNIERVQGDERDVIILTVGYAKGINGKLSYNWGPVQQSGGHRRVNVAISRAKGQMILVTSFGPEDVDPNYSQAEGFQLMRRFIEYAATGGETFGDEGAQHVPCNPFEADIQQRLEAEGLSVVPQWGVGGYRIDFAIQHPKQPGRFVLAVEADGASYHSGTVARERDRLRQQLLEARGWRFVRIWSSDYFFDPEPEIQRVLAAYASALAAGERTRIAAAPPGAENGRSPLPEAAAAPSWEETVSTRRAWPGVARGLPIGAYSDTELQRVVRWVISDDAPRTRAEIFEEAKAALGFQRNGKNIVEAISQAVDTVMSSTGRS